MPTAVRTLPEPYRSKLKDLGLDTVDDAVHIARASPDALSEYLGTPALDLLARYAPEAAAPYSATIEALLAMPRPVDSDLSIAAEVFPPAFTDRALVDAPQGTINLIDQMPPQRGQGPVRQTCVAFAGLAAYEHYLGISGNPVQLSEQFLYFACKQTDGHPDVAGTRLVYAYLALRDYGCCPLVDWDYNPQLVAGNEGEGPPPPGAGADAATYRLNSPTQLPVRTPQSIGMIRSFLSSQRCVAIGIPVYRSSTMNGPAVANGIFNNPVPPEQPVGSHAVCLVGYFDEPDHPERGGGYFICRNSWWPAWGPQSPFGPGYGAIPYSYVQGWATEAVAVAVG